MLHLLAELPAPDKEFVWQLILSAGVIISMMGNLYAVFGRKKIETQQPLIVEMQKEFASREELQKVDEQVTELGKSVNQRFADAAKAGSESREKLYTKINSIGESTAALKREAELQSVRQTQMDQKIDRLLERQADAKKA